MSSSHQGSVVSGEEADGERSTRANTNSMASNSPPLVSTRIGDSLRGMMRLLDHHLLSTHLRDHGLDHGTVVSKRIAKNLAACLDIVNTILPTSDASDPEDHTASRARNAKRKREREELTEKNLKRARKSARECFWELLVREHAKRGDLQIAQGPRQFLLDQMDTSVEEKVEYLMSETDSQLADLDVTPNAAGPSMSMPPTPDRTPGRSAADDVDAANLPNLLWNRFRSFNTLQESSWKDKIRLMNFFLYFYKLSMIATYTPERVARQRLPRITREVALWMIGRGTGGNGDGVDGVDVDVAAVTAQMRKARNIGARFHWFIERFSVGGVWYLIDSLDFGKLEKLDIGGGGEKKGREDEKRERAVRHFGAGGLALAEIAVTEGIQEVAERVRERVMGDVLRIAEERFRDQGTPRAGASVRR